MPLWAWLDALLLALFLDGALLVKWLVDRDFPLPAVPKKGATS